jgi:hypothetical protein
MMVAAVHENLRTSPDRLHEVALNSARLCSTFLASRGAPLGITVSTRVIKLAKYHAELGRLLSATPGALARARLGLWEDVPPMSLHVGVVRFGIGDLPLLDVLYDTTDSDRNLFAFCHVAFGAGALQLASVMQGTGLVQWGVPVQAF